jgi:hypothetical protein
MLGYLEIAEKFLAENIKMNAASDAKPSTLRRPAERRGVKQFAETGMETNHPLHLYECAHAHNFRSGGIQRGRGIGFTLAACSGSGWRHRCMRANQPPFLSELSLGSFSP